MPLTGTAPHGARAVIWALEYAPHGHGPDHGAGVCPSRARAVIWALEYAPHGHGPDHGAGVCPSRARAVIWARPRSQLIKLGAV